LEVFLLEEYKFAEVLEQAEVSALQTQLQQTSLDAKPTPFELLYGQKTSIEEKKSKDTEDLAHFSTYASQASLARLLDGPSHILPPLTTLFSKFMDILVVKDKQLHEETAEKTLEDANQHVADRYSNGVELDQQTKSSLVSQQLQEEESLLSSTNQGIYGKMVDFFKEELAHHQEVDVEKEQNSKKTKTPKKTARSNGQNEILPNGNSDPPEEKAAKKLKSSAEHSTTNGNGTLDLDKQPLTTPKKSTKAKVPAATPVSSRTTRSKSAVTLVHEDEEVDVESFTPTPRKRKLKKDVENGTSP